MIALQNQTGCIRTPRAVAQVARAARDPLAALDPLASAGASIAIKRGDEIVTEGDAAEYCYKVVSGNVRLVKLVADGRRQVCEFLVPGDFIGLTAEADHYFTAEATADSVLMRYPRRQVESLIAATPSLAQHIHKLTATGLQRAYERMGESGRARIIGLVLSATSAAFGNPETR